jgi:hypothetical protein
MSIYVKFTDQLVGQVRDDLERPHAFAWERVGFITAGAMASSGGDLILFCRRYMNVADEDYEASDDVGAQIGPEAMRKAAELAYNTKSALLHVHMHKGRGRPEFSRTDANSGFEFVPGFFNVQPRMPHGLIVLNETGARGLIWIAKDRSPLYVNDFLQVGPQLKRIGGK